MAYSIVPTVSTSDSWTASQHNTYIKDNFAAVWVGTTAGDMDYYTAATTKSRLAIGTSYQLLRSTGSAPAWTSLATMTANTALVSSQAAGDLFYATSSTATARLAPGALHTFLKSNGSTPSFGSITYRRQGGSATAWGTAGTTTYTPAIELIQKGEVALSISGGVGSVAVTFPQAFTAVPHIHLTAVLIGVSKRLSAPYVYARSTTGFTAAIYDIDGETYSIEVAWTASGQ